MELIQITSKEQFEEFRDDWSLILEENQNTNPFIEFVWVYEWWKHFGDQCEVEIMLVKHDEKPVGFFPFIKRRRWFGHIYNFMAFGQANYMNFVVYDHLLDSVIEFVFDEIIRTRKSVVFNLHGLLESSLTPERLEGYLHKKKFVFSIHRVITPYIDLEKIMLKEYFDKRQKLHRLSRREKRLRENGNVEFLQSEPDEMEYIFKLHDKQWEKKHDTSGFTNKKEKEFFRCLARIKEGPMKTEIDSLYLNNRMIAFAYGFKCRGRYLSYVLGYDSDFEIFSPGRILEKESILQCKRENVENYDLSIGYEIYKFEWNTHVDYTRRMIFSSNALTAKATRYFLSMKEFLIERIKENYRLVLFKRNAMGKLRYVFKNLFSRTELKEVRADLKEFLTRIRNYMYFRQEYVVYKMEKKDLPDVPDLESFIELTINDALNSSTITSNQMKVICRKIYGGYKGYHPVGILSFENIFWTNEKVLRIDNVSYIENFRKSSVFIENWQEGNLAKICSIVKRNSKAKTIFATVQSGSQVDIAALKSVGFSINKHIMKRTYVGFSKSNITS